MNSTIIEDIHYITLPAEIDERSIPQWVAKMEEWSKLQVQLHVFDFKSVQRIHDSFFTIVKDFSSQVQAAKARLVSLNMSEGIYSQVKNAGVEKQLSRVKNLSQDLAAPSKNLSETEKRRLLSKYLSRGAFKAVEVACRSTVSIDENYSVPPDQVPLENFDFISKIEVNCDFLKADFRLICSLEVLEKLCRAMLGPDRPLSQELLESTAKEMLNMIYGHAKSNLNDREGFRLPPAIPKLIRKEDFGQIKRSSAVDLTILPMVTPMGAFYVEVDFGV